MFSTRQSWDLRSYSCVNHTAAINVSTILQLLIVFFCSLQRIQEHFKMGNKVSYVSLKGSSESDYEEKPKEDVEETKIKEPVRPNIFSWISMNWIGDLIRQGNKHPLENEDLFPVDCLLPSEEIIEMLENAWNNEVRRASSEKDGQPKMWRALLNMHSFGTYLWVLMLNLFIVLLSVIQPIFLSFILSHLMLYGVDENIYMVYIFILIIFLLIIFMAIAETFFTKNTARLAVHFKTSLVGLALKKVGSGVALVFTLRFCNPAS